MRHPELVEQIERELRDERSRLVFWLRQVPLHDPATRTGRAVAYHVVQIEARIHHLEAAREAFDDA
jgi:hypothetical protein